MTTTRYSKTAIFLHWAIALTLAFQISLGGRLEEIEKGAGQFWAFQLHKSIGITILLLTLVRVGIRFVHPRPPLPADSGWAQRLAKTVHAGLYLVMLGAPITGWIIVSTSKLNFPTLLFGTVPLPHLPVPRLFHEPAQELHEWLAWLAIGLFLLHVAGALRHHFARNENLLGRMLPGLGNAEPSRLRSGVAAATALLLIFAAVAAAKILPLPTGGVATVGAVPALPAVPTVEVTPAPSAADSDALANTQEPAKPEGVPLATWTVVKGGELDFKTSWSGVAVNGRFTQWDADILFSPDQLDQSKIRVRVTLASADTADSQRDEMLRSDSFFDTVLHPVATFSADRIVRRSGDNYIANGKLTLKGQSRPVALRFSLKINEGRAQVRGSAQLSRTDFGVGAGEFATTDQVPDQVSVSFAFAANVQTR